MKKLSCFLLANILILSLFGQNIKLTQTKLADDIKITAGKYVIYFKKIDIVLAIPKIDSITKANNTAITDLIEGGKIKAVNISSSLPADKPFINLLKANLAAYLLTRGKAAIFIGAKNINQIVADESPEMVEMDGTSNVAISFSEIGSDDQLFLGNLNTKLKK